MILTTEDHYQPVAVKNVSGEVIPDDAVMQVTGAVLENGSRLVSVTKPDGTGSTYLINRRNSIPVARSGSALYGFGKSVLVTGTPAAGDVIGPVSGSWSMSASGAGFRVVGDVRDGRARVTPTGGSDNHGIARLNATLLSADANATIDGYRPTEGMAPSPALVSVENTYSLSGEDNDLCLVAKIGGTWRLVVIIEGAESDNHGIGRLVGDQLTTSATLNVDGYTPVEGSETFPAGLINNPNSITGVDNSQVLISKRAGVWEVVAALDTQGAQQHGIATAYTGGWLAGDATGQIENYKAVEGNETPGVEPATIQNPNGIATETGDQVLVSKQAGVWNAIAVIQGGGTQNHGIALLVGDQFVSGDRTIDNYLPIEGTETPGVEPATIQNPNVATGYDNDVVIVAKRAGVWEVVENITRQDYVALDAGDEATAGYLLAKLNLTPQTSVPAKHTKLVAVRNPSGAAFIDLYSKNSQSAVRVLKDIDLTFNPTTGELTLQKTFVDIDVALQTPVVGTPANIVEIWRDIITTYGINDVKYHLETQSGAAGPDHTDTTTDTCGSGA